MLDDERQAVFMTWLTGHAASVVKIARAYTRTPDECQDLAQEILLQAWRSLPKFGGKSTPATWFYRVALNTAMNWRRDDNLRRGRQQPLLELHVLAADDANSAQQVERRELVDKLYQAIHQLPKAAAALVLLYLEDLSYSEMADVLGISENNVGVQLNRAKKALTALMNGGPDVT